MLSQCGHRLRRRGEISLGAYRRNVHE